MRSTTQYEHKPDYHSSYIRPLLVASKNKNKINKIRQKVLPDITKRLRQWCSISPTLFKIKYIDKVP